MSRPAADRAVARRRAEDMAIACALICRYVGPVDDLVAALNAAGGSARLVKALRAELTRRREGPR